MQPPNRQDIGWEPIATLPHPQTAAETRTVWLLPRDPGLLPRKWVLEPGVEVPTDQFGHWRDEAKLEVFQDLLLRGPTEGHVKLRQALIGRAAGPWRHAAAREPDIAALASRDADIIAFEREGDGGVEPVALVLWSCDDGYKVTNVVPQKVGELGRRRYNIALQDFVENVARPAAAEAGFTVETSPATQGLDDWLPRQAGDALRRFSGLANKETGSLHPMDRQRWFNFLLAAHHSRGSLDAQRLVRWLTEIEGWSGEKALDLAVEYDFAMDLLDEYDRNRT
jgi:hypothetical protein